MNEKISNKEKRKVPVLSFEEFMEIEKGNKKIRGPFKIKAEDSEKALQYFKNR